MTIAVRDVINTNQFEDSAGMEKLDVIFAQRYTEHKDVVHTINLIDTTNVN